MGRFQDLTGKRYGKLLVLNRAEDYISPKGYKALNWNCQCDCGKKLIVRGCNLRSGASNSCGCNKIENPNRYIHGKINTRIYSIWCGIKVRCYSVNSASYNNYGRRGISMCQDWEKNFLSFYEWSINNGYNDSLTIDRVDNNGNYEPTNCRWTTYAVQNNNSRHNHLVTYNGITLNMKQWSDKTGIKYQKIKDRINNCGWDIETSLTVE